MLCHAPNVVVIRLLSIYVVVIITHPILLWYVLGRFHAHFLECLLLLVTEDEALQDFSSFPGGIWEADGRVPQELARRPKQLDCGHDCPKKNEGRALDTAINTHCYGPHLASLDTIPAVYSSKNCYCCNIAVVAPLYSVSSYFSLR